MRTDLLTQTGDWPDEPVSCSPHCPDPACTAQATMLLATPGQADLRCPSSGAEVPRTLVRAELLPHAEQTG